MGRLADALWEENLCFAPNYRHIFRIDRSMSFVRCLSRRTVRDNSNLIGGQRRLPVSAILLLFRKPHVS